MATSVKQERDLKQIPPKDREIPPAGETEEEEGGKRRLLLPIVAILVVIGGIWAYRQWSYSRTHETTDDAAIDGHLVPVLARASGYIQAVNANDNDHVKADSLLVQIDPTDYKVRLTQAEADLAAARAAAGGPGLNGQAQANVEQAMGQRGALDAQVVAARANATKAHQDLARFEELARNQIISRQQLDAAKATAEAADAAVSAAERQASAATGTVSSAQAGVNLAQARLASAQAARDNAALQLAYTQVRAPESGIVSRKQAEPGQLVQVGQPLLTIVSDTGVFVTANFKETQLADIRVGQPVEIDVDAYGGAKAEGKVESLSAATGSKFALLPPDNATGNFTKVVQRVPVRIKITKALGPDRPMRPGMSVTARVVTH